MGRRWGKEDDAKLSSLFATARNSVNPKDLSVAAVKAVHNKFFPEKDYRNFAPLYRAKARAFQVGKTLEGHRQRSRQAKAAIRKDVEDDKESDVEDYEDEEEDDVDLDEDEFEEEDEATEVEEVEEEIMPRTPPQKAAQKAAPTINELTDRVSAMAIERKKPSAYKNWSMDFNFPFMIKTFLHDGRESVTVDLLIPTVYEERVHPRVVSQGTSLAVGVAIPDFFPEEDRVLVAMGHNNINSSQAAAHSEVVQQIRKQYNDMPEIIGNPQIIKLPFPCKEQIVHWENQLFSWRR